jgi:hypothetical protein
MTEIEEINEFPMDAACGNCGFRWQTHRKHECPTGLTDFRPAVPADLVIPAGLDHALMYYREIMVINTPNIPGDSIEWFEIESAFHRLAKEIRELALRGNK